MKIKIDYQLNRRFGVVERIIFRLVLNGFTDSKEIAKVMPLFSDSVIANAIKRLVNYQILAADITAGKLSLSEPLVAITDMCLENTYEVNAPGELKDFIATGGLIISGISGEESNSLKRALLSELLPGIKLDLYVDSIDFVLFEERDN